MKPPRKKHVLRLSRGAAVLLLLAFLFTGGGRFTAPRAPGAGGGFAVVSARGAAGQDTYEELQAELDGLEQAEDVERVVAYKILLPFLPPGTRMTSGYRSPEKQLSLIRNYAIRRGISVPDRMVVDEPSTWTNAWQSLRAQGFIIASPNHTPHGNPERIVFDLAGPNLHAIKRGCEVAESRQMVKFLRAPLVEEVNGCVHIEVHSFAAKALAGLRPRIVGAQQQPASGGGGSGGASPMPTPDQEKLARIQERQELISNHDASPDPLKQIDYDLLIIRTLDLSDPAELSYRSVLLNEIKDHRQQAEQNVAKARESEAEAEKQALIAQVTAAAQEGRDEEAERLAKTLSEKYPEQAKVYPQMVARRKVGEALNTFIEGDCNRCSNVEGGACVRAAVLMKEALVAQPEDQQAKRLKDEMETTRSNCRTGRWVRIVLLVLLILGLFVGLYFWLRPGKYVLECIFGPCRGEVFPLDKSPVRVGAMASSEEEQVDIVISDPERKISRVHCLLTQSGRHWYLKDESTNGTTINDLPAEKGGHQRLEGGDEISLADGAVLLFRRR